MSLGAKNKICFGCCSLRYLYWTPAPVRIDIGQVPICSAKPEPVF